MAEFKRFDPYRWEPEAGDGGVAKAAKSAKLHEPTLATLATLAGLPDEFADGLKRLSRMAVPRCASADPWVVAVADAQRLATGPWASQALALGWTPLDLFGAVIDPAGDPDADGLAVKLEGRPVLALCASFATVSDGPGDRSFIHRGNNNHSVLLWNLDRGR